LGAATTTNYREDLLFVVAFTEPIAVLIAAAADTDGNGTVERNEWANFIFHMANADLRSTSCSLDDAPH
jgi:hypothetical protein